MAKRFRRNIRNRIYHVQNSARVSCPRSSSNGSTSSSGKATNNRWRIRTCGAWSRKTCRRKSPRGSSITGTNQSPKARKLSRRPELHQQRLENHRLVSTSRAQRQRSLRASSQLWWRLSAELSFSVHAWNSFKTSWHSHHLKCFVCSLITLAETSQHGVDISTLVFCSESHQRKHCSLRNISTACSSLDFAFEQL